MSGKPTIRDESVLTRWMQLELGRMNEGVVSQRKTLSELLIEDHPVSTTKAGKEYRFSKEIIDFLGEHLPAGIHSRAEAPYPVIFSIPRLITAFFWQMNRHSGPSFTWGSCRPSGRWKTAGSG